MDGIEGHPIEEPGAIRKEGSLEALSLSSKLCYLQNCFLLMFEDTVTSHILAFIAALRSLPLI